TERPAFTLDAAERRAAARSEYRQKCQGPVHQRQAAGFELPQEQCIAGGLEQCVSRDGGEERGGGSHNQPTLSGSYVEPLRDGGRHYASRYNEIRRSPRDSRGHARAPQRGKLSRARPKQSERTHGRAGMRSALTEVFVRRASPDHVGDNMRALVSNGSCTQGALLAGAFGVGIVLFGGSVRAEPAAPSPT